MSQPIVLPNPTAQEIISRGNVSVIMPPVTWKPIRHYDGLYEISNTGHYRNSKTGKVLKFVKNNHGYLRAELYKKGVRKRFMIHRLVANAFCEIPKGYTLMDVNHIDGNKKNNQQWNLEYLTKSDNHVHRHHVLGKNNLGVGKAENSPSSKMRVHGLTLNQLSACRSWLDSCVVQTTT